MYVYTVSHVCFYNKRCITHKSLDGTFCALDENVKKVIEVFLLPLLLSNGYHTIQKIFVTLCDPKISHILKKFIHKISKKTLTINKYNDKIGSKHISFHPYHQDCYCYHYRMPMAVCFYLNEISYPKFNNVFKSILSHKPINGIKGFTLPPVFYSTIIRQLLIFLYNMCS